jgi:hypothetical protein
MTALLAMLLGGLDCGACHREQHEQWLKSAHATSATNPLFLAAHRREPMQWCVTCHAQVGCATCHLREGKVLSSRAPTAAGERAHAMQHEPQLARSEACAACHQFNFPVGRREPVQLGPHPMQNTFEEWRASTDARQCQGCHGDHRMSGAHDVEKLRGAIELTARRVGREARFELKSRGVGHALPTGDPFRRFVVELCVEPSCARPAAAVELGRTIEPVGETWRIGADLSLPASGAPRVVSLAAGPSAGCTGCSTATPRRGRKPCSSRSSAR